MAIKSRILVLLVVLPLILLAFTPSTVNAQAPVPDPGWVAVIMSSIEAGNIWVQYGAQGVVNGFVFSTDVLGTPLMGQVHRWKILQLGYVSAKQAGQVYMLLDGLQGWTQVQRYYDLPRVARMFISAEVAVKAAALNMTGGSNVSTAIIGAVVSQAYAACPSGTVTLEEYNNMTTYSKMQCSPVVSQ